MTAADEAWRDAPARTGGWRNRLIGSRRFQRWAAGFPIIRRFARRDGERLFDLMAGFVYSQVLQACVELRLFHALRPGPLTPTELADRIGLDPERTTALCRAAAGIDLLERRRDGRFRLSRLGAAVLDVPGIEPMIRHHRLFYRDIEDPVALLRAEVDTELARYWPYVLEATTGDVPPRSAETYSELMAASQALVAEETLRAIRLDGVTRLMDVGGGTGAFLAAVAEATPRIELTLFDLPAVGAAAARRFAAHGLSDRITIVGGTFRSEALPGGADAISLVRVLYDHADDTVADLLARAHAALPPGGLLILSEPMSGGNTPDRFGDGYFAFYTMAMRTGRVRAPAEITGLLRAAGFVDVRVAPGFRPFITQVMTARKPG